MSADFPAAHSMDTEWFAVDSEGHVGFFETGEPGPVPVGARSGEFAYEWFKQLFFAAPGLLLLNARSESAIHAHELLHANDPGRMYPFDVDSSLCMLLRSKEYLSQLGEGFEVGPETVTHQGTAIPVYMHDMDDQVNRTLHEAGACLGCIALWWPRQNRGERLGIFNYNARYNYHNGPYERIGIPDKPLLLSQLPAEVQSLIAAFPLPLRFDKEQYVQPLELVPCRTWGGSDYLASDMKTIRPMPEPK